MAVSQGVAGPSVAIALGMVLAVTAQPPAFGAEDRITAVTLQDGRGDVWTGDDGEEAWALAGDKPTADVTRAAVKHRRKSVVVRMRFSNLRRVGDEHSFAAFIYTGRNARIALVKSASAHRAGRHRLYDQDSGAMTCRRMRHDIDYRGERVVIRVPRRCLRRPKWVRVSVFNIMGKEYEDQRGYRIWTDNPHNGSEKGGTTRRLYRQKP